MGRKKYIYKNIYRIMTNTAQGKHISGIDVEKSKKAEKILMIANIKKNSIVTVENTVYQVIEKSQYSIDLLNICYGIPYINKKALNQYRAIMIHDTVSYVSDHFLEVISPLYLQRYTGIKVLFMQDEHYCTDVTAKFIKDNKIDLLLTIWDIKTAEEVYCKQQNSQLHIMQYLTGYVPKTYYNLQYPLQGRPIDVGYRGSLQPMLFGQLAYEKHHIGDEFTIHAIRRNLRYDISSKWEDRFMGKEWLDFLGSCKAVLGVESGSNIVDYDGIIREKYEGFLKEHPLATEQEQLDFLEPYEGKIKYNAISPRHFEAAACRSLQILFEGEYQGIFQPNRHYLPLKKDFSNVDEVIDKMLDDKVRKEIVECAYEEIVLNERYSFDYFVRQLDEQLRKLFEKR